MHAVAKAAVFADRVMLPQERTAYFRVTTVAILVDTELFQSGGSGGTMCIVAISADQVPFPDGVRGGTIDVSPYGVMAIHTHVGLCRPVQFQMGPVDFVTTGTRQCISSVHTRLPVNERAPLMALQTHAVLCFPGFHAVAGEGYQATPFPAFRCNVQMLFTRPMAGFTTMGSHGRAPVSGLPMPVLRQLFHVLIVAIRAAFCADVITLRRIYLLRYFTLNQIIIRSQHLHLCHACQNDNCTCSSTPSIQPIHARDLYLTNLRTLTLMASHKRTVVRLF